MGERVGGIIINNIFNDTSITGVLGLQGAGKTMTTTAIAEYYYKQGRDIYSNYHLKDIDYTPVNTLEDAQKMKDCIFFGDELWLWVFSRSSMTHINRDLTKIIMLNRKRRVTIFYTAQLMRTVDVILREVTNYWIRPWKIPVINDKNEMTYTIKFVICDITGRIRGVYILDKDLNYWGKKFNTFQEIDKITNRSIEDTLVKGIALENDFIRACKKITWINDTDHYKNSGHMSGKKYDVVLYTKWGNIAVDVKSSNKQRVSVDPKTLNAFINNAHDHNMKPFISFPLYDKTQLTNPKFWYIHSVENSYLLELNGNPFYDKILNNSIPLLEFNRYLEMTKLNII